MLASRAALAMQERMAEFAALQTRAGTFTCACGSACIAARSSPPRSAIFEHIELVVTGRNINRVALAQEIAEPGEVVISGATSALLPRRVEPRQSGFRLLSSDMPTIDTPPAMGRWEWADPRGGLHELAGLAERLDALRPICRAVCRAASWSHLSLRAGPATPASSAGHGAVRQLLPLQQNLDMLGTIAILPWAC